ncbi:phosphonate C-P lyase system protein PhnH [Phormidium tenue FACHB-886]|nr:phosphonate C-P lyase system protein PhnH [Phormidium tenue FACHB-886]
MVTSLPGFQDVVHEAQATFRTLLEALAHPGRSCTITSSITPPGKMSPACAAACLTLLDLETQVWLQPGLEIEPWLRFHTGCRFTTDPQQANFAVIWDVARSLNLQAFNPGTAEYPELSTTLLIQVEDGVEGEAVVLQGPGILGKRTIAPQLPGQFWQQWLSNHQAYPLGVDVFLFGQTHVMGLPRTTAIQR